MKAIVELSDIEYKELNTICKNLRENISGTSIGDLISVEKRYGYAHYKFSGKYYEKLVELLGRNPTNDEIIILVDGGFSHFGASCSVNHATGSFSGRVHTD